MGRGSGSALAIHRLLWGDGVETVEAAAAHINDLIRAHAERHLGRPPRHVSDLGCGVGGTLLHLAAHWPDAVLTGVTLSPVQVQTATEEAHRRGLAARCRVIQSDFTSEPEDGDVEPSDLVLAVESHVHADSAAAFFTAARRYVAPEGLLILVDDMLLRPEDRLTEAERRWCDAFRRGWRLGHVPDREGLTAVAANAGFELIETTDLTPLIRLDRLRDRALHVVGPLAQRLGLNRWPIFGNMIGGDALTRLYRLGVMRYTLMVFRRAPTEDPQGQFDLS